MMPTPRSSCFSPLFIGGLRGSAIDGYLTATKYNRFSPLFIGGLRGSLDDQRARQAPADVSVPSSLGGFEEAHLDALDPFLVDRFSPLFIGGLRGSDGAHAGDVALCQFQSPLHWGASRKALTTRPRRVDETFQSPLQYPSNRSRRDCGGGRGYWSWRCGEGSSSVMAR